MPPPSSKESNAISSALTRLLAARDEMRIRAHLLEEDARDKWDRIEAAILDIEVTIATRAEEMTADFADAVVEFADTVRGFVDLHAPGIDGAG